MPCVHVHVHRCVNMFACFSKGESSEVNQGPCLLSHITANKSGYYKRVEGKGIDAENLYFSYLTDAKPTRKTENTTVKSNKKKEKSKRERK